MAGKLTKGQKALIGIVLLTLVVACSATMGSLNQERTLETRIESAKAQGYPFKPDKIVEGLDDQPGENAAPFYERLRERARSLTIANERQVAMMVDAVPGTSFTEGQWELLEQYLDGYSPILDDLEFASQLDYCYFQKDWEDVLELRFVELMTVKTTTRHLMARIGLSVRQGEYEAVERDLKTIRRYSRHFESQPTIFGPLSSMALSNWVMASGIATLLPAAEKNPELRSILREAVEGMPESWDLTRPLQMSAFEEYWYIENVVAKGRIESLIERYADYSQWEIDEWKTAAEDGLQSSSAVRNLKMAVLDIWAPLLLEYDPSGDELAVLEEAGKRQDESIKRSSEAELYFTINPQGFYSLARSIKGSRARRRTLLAALDVLDYRSENGPWPSALPQSYTDPFTDEPLLYRVTTDGFRIWSVGQDRKDNGGTTRDEDRFGYDVVVVFPPILQPFESMVGGPGLPGAGVPAVGLGSPP